MLDDDERERNARFVRDADRRRDLLSRALVRTVLSTYSDVPPECWRFDAEANGRPRIAMPEVHGLHFNLAHADDLVVCAVAREPAIGIDVERIDCAAAIPDALCDRERRALEGLPPETFFDYWTLHEAHAKATGLGIAEVRQRDDWWFELTGAHGATLFHRNTAATRWWFHRLRPAPGYVMAVALETNEHPKPQLLLHAAPAILGI